MKLKLKQQTYQTDVVKAMVDCFAGQPKSQGFKSGIRWQGSRGRASSSSRSSAPRRRSIGHEIKLSNAPKPGKGFWHACEDLGVERAYVVAPVLEPYALADNAEVVSPLMLPGIAASAA